LLSITGTTYRNNPYGKPISIPVSCLDYVRIGSQRLLPLCDHVQYQVFEGGFCQRLVFGVSFCAIVLGTMVVSSSSRHSSSSMHDYIKSYSALFLVRVGYGCYMYHLTSNIAKKCFTEPPHSMQSHIKIYNQVLATHHHHQLP